MNTELVQQTSNPSSILAFGLEPKERSNMKRNSLFTLIPVLGLASILLFRAVASPGYGYISVAPPAFQPESHTYQYQINSLWIRNSDGNSDDYHAPIQLPHGATVTKLTFFWEDGSSSNGYCSLWRQNMAGSFGVSMAIVYTSGDTGVADSSENTTISFATVDNTLYSYGLTINLPDSAVEAYGVVVEYQFGTTLPLVLRSLQAQ
jgi:hypothetical protein